MNTPATSTDWNLPIKIAFRFFFILFILFIVINNNGAFPFWYYVMMIPTEALHVFIPWVGKNLLSLSEEITIFTNGSGDTTYDYVLVFTMVMISLVGTFIWSLVDHKSRNYNLLYYWLTVAVRFYVGLMLINYGLVKVVQLQFPPPDIYRLTQQFGDASPMGLAWTFLGFSKGYNMFMGIAEIAAVLLLFRRTMTFGAIITLMTTANVMAVNFFFDVPVKILSTTLVCMTLFLLLKDARRLFHFFFTGKAVSLPIIEAPVIKTDWLRWAKIILKSLIIGYALIFGFINTQSMRKMYGDKAPKPTFYGLYEVEFHSVNKDTLPALVSDPIRWNQLLVRREGYAHVRHMSDSISRFTTELDTIAKTYDFTPRNDSGFSYSFHYTVPDSSSLILTGIMNGDSVKIDMKRKNLKDFRLISRGFNWINEYPYNR